MQAVCLYSHSCGECLVTHHVDTDRPGLTQCLQCAVDPEQDKGEGRGEGRGEVQLEGEDYSLSSLA